MILGFLTFLVVPSVVYGSPSALGGPGGSNDPCDPFYVLLPYIIYVMPSGRFLHYPAFLSRTAKERDKKYSVKSPQRYKM
jgi:hypothetical protein